MNHPHVMKDHNGIFLGKNGHSMVILRKIQEVGKDILVGKLYYCESGET